MDGAAGWQFGAASSGGAPDDPQTAKLIHELQVHELELEIQNRDLREAQVSLEQSRARYADLYDFAPVAYLTLDSEGQIIDLNLTACTMLGREREKLIGRSFPQVASIREPGSFWSHLKQCIETGRRVASELTLNAQSSGPTTVEMVTIAALGSGGQLAFRSALTDVTMRKHAEASLQFLVDTGIALSETLDTQRSLDLVAQLSLRQFGSICITQITEEGDTVSLTGAAASEEYPDRVLTEIKQAFTLLPGVAESVSQVVKTGKGMVVDTLQTMNSLGSELSHSRWVQELGIAALAVLPLHARGRTFGVLLIGRSAKEDPLTQAELRLAKIFTRRSALAIDNAQLFEQARRATQARDQALALISHDLRGGIASIAWNAQLLLSKTPIREQPGGRRQLELIEQAALWMKRLTGDLLNSSQIESGTLEVALEPLRAHQLVKEAIALLSSEAAQSSVRLEMDVPDGLFIQADSERVSQILINLLSNGVKFSPAGGRVLVRARPLDGEAQFEIADQGRGIEEADLPHVFERYWRRHSKGGVGLGLFIARGIVEAHGGSMRVESRPGEGATFIFSLPLADTREVAAYPPA
jgi:PAS domain S-box-containing protein